MPIFYFIVSLLILLPDLYIRLVSLRGIDLGWWNLLFWAPLAFFVFLLVLYFAGGPQPFVFKGMVSAILCLTVPKLLFCIVSILGRAAGYIAWDSGGSEVLRGALTVGFDAAGIVLAGCFLVSAVYGLTYGPKRLEVREETLTFEDLPASFDGYRIVHLADLHARSYAAPGMVEKLVAAVNNLDADLVAFTGDLVNSSPSELDSRMTAVLSSIRARDGVFSVVGNHDYCEYHDYSTADGAARAFAEVVRGPPRAGDGVEGAAGFLGGDYPDSGERPGEGGQYICDRGGALRQAAFRQQGRSAEGPLRGAAGVFLHGFCCCG